MRFLTLIFAVLIFVQGCSSKPVRPTDAPQVRPVVQQKIDQAREARMQILEVMNATIAEPRSDVGETAPKMISFEI